MVLHAFTIPDDPAGLSGWLDRRVIGEDLPELVAELAAIHAVTAAVTAPLLSLLPEAQLKRVLAEGTGRLPRETVQRLLREPFSLFELQDKVLTEGGPYWDSLMSPGPASAQLAETWKKIEAGLSSPAGPGVTRERGWYARPWPWVLNGLIAAGVFWAATVLTRPKDVTSVKPPDVNVAKVPDDPHKDALVWTRPEKLGAITDPAEYMHALAAVGEWWNREPPKNRLEFASRLGELRRGCSMLINSPHTPLPEDERKLLVEKCREWAGQMSAILEGLEDPAVNHLINQNQADNLVRRMTTRLKAGFRV